jgi:hypothetical protein
MPVVYYYVRKLLHISNAVCKTHWKFGADIVGGVDDAPVVEVAAAKEYELQPIRYGNSPR